MILKILNVDKTFVRTFERSSTFANADERSQKINMNVQNSILNCYIQISKLKANILMIQINNNLKLKYTTKNTREHK